MKRHVLVVSLMVFAWLGVSRLIHKQQEGTERMIQEIESGIRRWDTKEVRKLIDAAETNWTEAMNRLEEGDCRGSFRAYFNAKSSLSHFLEHYPENELEPDLTLKNWFEQKEQPYFAAVLEDFPRMLSGVAEGTVSADEFRQHVRSFEQAGLPDLAEQFEAKKEEISEKRIALARNSLRVELMEDTHGFHELVREALQKKWDEQSGFRLFVGSTLDSKENAAIWKTLRVQIDAKQAQYRLSNQHVREHVELPKVLESAKITFKISGARDVPTSWDELPLLSAAADVPEQIYLKSEYRGGGAEAERAVRESREQLLSGIVQELEKLPKFRLFPEIDPLTTQIRTANGLDFTAAHALSHLDTNRFLGELKSLSKSPDREIQQDALLIVAKLQVESFADELTRQLPGLEYRQQSQVLKELARHPGFGNYEPLLAIFESPDPGQNIGLVVDALKNEMAHENVRNAFVRKINSRSISRRDMYAHAFFSSVPAVEIERYASQWIRDPDERLVTEVYRSVRDRDSDLGTKLLLDHFDSVGPNAQTWMIEVGFNPQTDGPEVLQLLKKAALQKHNQLLRRNAYHWLLKFSRTKAGWDVLHELENLETEPEKLNAVRSELVSQARHAVPERATEFLLDQVATGEGDVRNLAVYQLLTVEDSSLQEHIATVANLVQANARDQKLVNQTILAIQYAHQLRRVDFLNLEKTLEPVLLMGAKHSSGQTRQASYALMAAGIESGSAAYKSMLQRALAVEPNQELRQRFAQKIALAKE